MILRNPVNTMTSEITTGMYQISVDVSRNIAEIRMLDLKLKKYAASARSTIFMTLSLSPHFHGYSAQNIQSTTHFTVHILIVARR